MHFSADGCWPDVAERSSCPQTVLDHCHPWLSDLDLVRLLLSFDADVNLEDGDGWTALHNATKEGHLLVVRELVDRGAKLEHR